MGSMVLQVFDTLEHGQSYREYCTQVARLLLCCEQTTAPVLRELPHRVHTADVAHVNGATDVQVLKQPLADLVTLDLKRISGKGNHLRRQFQGAQPGRRNHPLWQHTRGAGKSSLD